MSRRRLLALAFHLVSPFRALLAGAILVAFTAALPAATSEPTQSAPCPACNGTGVCQNNGCKEGKMLCPATCLKKESPGWKTKHFDDHPDGILWMPWEYNDGSKRIQYISEAHIGELIDYENGRPMLRGQCPTCQGTSRVTCTACKGDAKCALCHGAGKFIRNETLFTLTDAQGRAMEAVVRARQTDKITVLRLADRKVFDIPLDKLSAESNEIIEQKFPLPKAP